MRGITQKVIRAATELVFFCIIIISKFVFTFSFLFDFSCGSNYRFFLYHNKADVEKKTMVHFIFTFYLFFISFLHTARQQCAFLRPSSAGVSKRGQVDNP